MRKLAIIALIAPLITISCRKTPSDIPIGVWRYRLLMNGAPLGIARISNSNPEGTYRSTFYMEMNAGIIKKTTRHETIESESFRPNKLVVEKVSTENGKAHQTTTTATFKSDGIQVSMNGSEAMIKATHPFILEGNCNYFLHEFIKAGFKQGTVIKSYIYDPSIDLEEPVLMIGKVIGRVEIDINGTPAELTHLGYSVENYKNMDVFIDKDGVIQRMIIYMLNNRLDLIIHK